jgi:aspartate aminotransferase
MNKISNNVIKNTWSIVGSSLPDSILGLTIAYNNNKNPNKVNLGVGAYRSNDGKPYMLECVKTAQSRQLEKSIEYAPIDGLPDFIKASQKLAFGDELLDNIQIATVQTLSGTGSLRVGAEFLSIYDKIKKPHNQEYGYENFKLHLPKQTWPNHNGIISKTNLITDTYTYYDTEINQINFDKMICDIYKMYPGSVVLFHACAHNPTGTDPTTEQWKELSHVCKKKSHIVWFDSAYQGFASGDLLADSESYKIFIRDGHPIMLSQSFAKNMGLYGMRIGALHVVTSNQEEKINVIDKLKTIIRPMYSSPPVEGARIVSEIINDPLLYKIWIFELKLMADRICQMRIQLKTKLEAIGSIKDWSHITNQIGMFCYTGLNSEQVHKLIHEHHIYLTSDGRISMAGLNTGNIDYVANCIHKVTK